MNPNKYSFKNIYQPLNSPPKNRVKTLPSTISSTTIIDSPAEGSSKRIEPADKMTSNISITNNSIQLHESSHHRDQSRTGLPRTIEAATQRYLNSYKQQYRGSAAEMLRLKTLAESKILMLRKKAPSFYESRLAQVVNQAGSALLTCDTFTKDGLTKFHNLHKSFLRVLDELAKSQPAGEVDFQKEKDRAEERDKLLKDHLKLHQKLTKLEATEIVFDEIGEEDPDSKYAKFYDELDRTKDELRKVSLMIAKMEGERIDEEPDFKLIIEKTSTLKLLTEQQLNKLEQRIAEMVHNNRNKRRTFFVNYGTMEEHILALGLEQEKFSPSAIKDLIKDTLDAFTRYYRGIDNKKREAYHQSLISNPSLKPRDGKILSDPNDLPPEVLQKMDMDDRMYLRKVDEVIEKYTALPGQDVDKGEAIDEDGDDVNDVALMAVDTYAQKNEYAFNRVKEEPRDDYEDELPSDDEKSVPVALADSIDTNIQAYKKLRTSSKYGEGLSVCLQSNTSITEQTSQLSIDKSPNLEPQVQETQTDEQMEVLGIVAPTDKYEVIEID